MTDPNNSDTLKWGDSIAMLSDGRKHELRYCLEAWNPAETTDDHLGPFAGKRLNGLEVFWLAACWQARKDGDPITGAMTLLTRPYTKARPGLPLMAADLKFAGLKMSRLPGARLTFADLRTADLRGADLRGADLRGAYLRMARLQGSLMSNSNMQGADLSHANMTSSDLSVVQFIQTNLSCANLSDCRIYGISVWESNLDGAIQSTLRITPPGEAEITVDNLEIAQFLYLMLHNDKIRYVIDTIAKKLVLILGRFTPDRKRILDALRDELRSRNYLPVVFDFEKPASRDLTETISILAHMARFVIADLTDAKSIPQELAVIIPNLPSVAVQPLIQSDDTEFALFERWQRFPWVLAPYRYETLDTLLAALADHVIAPAEQRANEIVPTKRQN